MLPVSDKEIDAERDAGVVSVSDTATDIVGDNEMLLKDGVTLHESVWEGVDTTVREAD